MKSGKHRGSGRRDFEALHPPGGVFIATDRRAGGQAFPIHSGDTLSPNGTDDEPAGESHLPGLKTLQARLPNRHAYEGPRSQAPTGEEGQRHDASGDSPDPADGGGTLKAIAQELEARGVRTPAGRDRWAPAQVSRLVAG